MALRVFYFTVIANPKAFNIMEDLTEDQALDFFSEFYFGEHHIPRPLRRYGRGWYINHDRGGMATFDYDQLTKLVIMTHDKCVRVELIPVRNGVLKIAIWKRLSSGMMHERHPTIEQAIESYRGLSNE
jgi:hypothetical protein